MAFDAFMKVDGIDSESTDDKHKGWIEILSFSFGVAQNTSGSASSGGARSAERADIEAALPADLVANVRRVEEGRRGVFLVKADREMCSACHVRVRPQVYQEIKQATRIHACSNCKRYLYFEAALRSEAPTEAAAGDASGASINL